MGKKKQKNARPARPADVQKKAAPEEATPQPAPPVTEVAPPGRGRSRVWLIAVPGVLLIGGGILLLLFGRGLIRDHVTPGQYKGYNLLLVTLDTTRADHLPAYGYTNVKTPNLDKLAADSITFRDAISQVPLTLPAHTTIMTGLLPITHGVRDNGGYFVDPKDTTLAMVLKANGYATSAFVSAFVLDSRWGLNQGFDFYFDHFNLAEFQDVNPGDIQRRGDETESEAENWLQQHKNQKFFSWVHFYDPHDPYDPPEPYHSEYQDRLYDGEIAFTDDVLGRLLRKLEEFGVADRTVVLITGDHGESLGEHSETSHGMFIYNATQHVPLFLHLPGQKREDVRGVVRHIDVAPTLLSLLGLDTPKAMQGSSLIPMINGTEKTPRMAFSESPYAEIHYGWSMLRALTTDQYKYVEAPKPELYDRIKDPGETTNLIREKASIAKVLAGDLSELVSRDTRKDLKGPAKMDPETEEKLRALGYLSGSTTSTPETRKIDPKDKVVVADNIVKAFRAVLEKDYKRGLELVTPVLREDPEIIDAHFLAGVTYADLERYQESIDELMKTIQLRPDHTGALYNLGYAYEMTGNLKEAEHWYLQVLKYKEHHLFAAIKLAHLYQTMNQPEKAKPYFLDAVKFYEKGLKETTLPKSKGALYATLGEIYFGAGDFDRAEENLKAALELTPHAPTLHYNLAQVYEAKRSFPDAVEQYRQEIEVAPENFRALNNLGILYVELNRMDDAVLCFERVIQLRPQDQRGYMLLASTYQKMGRQQDAMKVMQSSREAQNSPNSMR